jgi:hypothetical protein
MRGSLLKNIIHLSKSYENSKPNSLARKDILKRLHITCRILIEKSNSERNLRECCIAIPEFCHARKIADKKLNRLLRAKEERNKRFEDFTQSIIRVIFFRKFST